MQRATLIFRFTLYLLESQSDMLDGIQHRGSRRIFGPGGTLGNFQNPSSFFLEVGWRSSQASQDLAGLAAPYFILLNSFIVRK